MPISFNQINSLPDILGSDRFMAMFPNLPGGGEGRGLTLRNVEVTLPPFENTQIIAKILGWSIAFAGRRTQQNSLTMAFYEDYTGYTHNTLLSWQNVVSGFVSPIGMFKKDYATDVEIRVFDTTGQVSLQFRANNVWPMRVTPAPLTDSNEPYRVDVDFSVDSVDYLAVVDETAGVYYGSAYNSPSLNRYRAMPVQSIPFRLPYMPQQLQMTALSSYAAMSSFLKLNLEKQVTIDPNGLNRQGGLTGLSSALGINRLKRFGGR